MDAFMHALICFFNCLILQLWQSCVARCIVSRLSSATYWSCFACWLVSVASICQLVLRTRPIWQHCTGGVPQLTDHYQQNCVCRAFNGALCFVQSAVHNLYSRVLTEVGGMQDGLENQAEEQRQKQARANRRLEKLQRDLRYKLRLCVSA